MLCDRTGGKIGSGHSGGDFIDVSVIVVYIVP